MHLFYIPEASEGFTLLGKEESWHCTRVLRLEQGAPVFLTDGKGNLFDCKIQIADPKKCIVKVTGVHKECGKRSFFLHIAIAPTKSTDRFEWFLEKATEIGIDEITPLLTAHSERKSAKTERLQKVMIAAMKQSLKMYLPALNEVIPIKKFVGQPFSGQKFIAYCEKEKTVELKQIYRPGENALVLIGPEGDFSPEEVEIAERNGFIPVSLGPSRLRTETAGIVACATVNLLSDA
jgi:16S rRNA (uracil1498-N3)-methyltransferase